jgi:DNA-directed RNA polymerase subunit H (RpoH/RPB5)
MSSQSQSSTQFQKSALIKSIYISRKNIIYYLKEQGFDVSQYETFNIAEINAMEQNSNQTSELNFDVYKKDENGETEEKCSVVYYMKSNIKQTILDSIATEFYEDEEHADKSKTSLIVVSQNPMNDSLHKILKKMWKKYGEYIVLMDLKSTQFNILTHEMVPRHTKLTKNEKMEVYQKYNVANDKQLPEISMFDPVAKALLMRPGDVCKIMRHDKISYINEFYRVCVV